MAKFIQAIRGMNDILPEATRYWQRLETVLRQIVAAYGYQEIRFPIVENTELFKRSIGEVTDIVEKEMYTFTDRNGDSLTLRPEGTAGCVRAGLEHGLLYNQIQRLWYSGSMYRHERPQKGRYREFYQVGVEAYGIADPGIDAELIAMSARFWRALGIEQQVQLQINSLGTAATRQVYREALVKYFENIAADLDEDSQRRLHTNPLRILDSKNPAMQTLIAGAPKMLDYLDKASQAHFTELQQLLKAMDITYEVNPRLVRGLDYYSDTVFEWVTDSLGAQGTVCAGGRYDGLVEQLGGKAMSAVGFALGLERLLLLYREVVDATDLPAVADAYLIMVGNSAKQAGFLLAEQLHDALPNLHLVKDCNGGSFKSQFKRADKSGATLAFIVGDEEVAAKTISVKFLRETRDQQTMKFDELLEFLKEQQS